MAITTKQKTKLKEKASLWGRNVFCDLAFLIFKS
jgi:hypothetical protein